MVDMTAWLESRLSWEREPRKPPEPRLVRSSLVTDFVRFKGLDLEEEQENNCLN